MKTMKFLFVAIIATLISSCATANLKGLHSSNYIYRQPSVKSHSVNSLGLYGSNVKVEREAF